MERISNRTKTAKAIAKKDINLNTAAERQLASVSKLGGQKARELIQHRPFKSWGDVMKISGFDRSIVEALKKNGFVIRRGQIRS